MILLILFFYIPLIQLLGEGISDKTGLTLTYLTNIVTDPYYLEIILFTAKQAFYSVLLSIIIGFPWAWILTNFRFPGRKTLRSLTIVPFVLPAITVVAGFITFFGNNGVLNRFLMQVFSLQKTPLPILYSLRGIVLAHAFYNAPIITRMVHAQWENLGPSYVETARSLGASKFRTFLDITLPLLVPGLVTGSALAFIFCFLSFPIVLTLGGIQFSTIEVEIYTLVNTMGDFHMGASLAIVEIFLSLLFTYGYLQLGGKFSFELRSLRPSKPIKLFSRPISPSKTLALVFAFGSSILFLGPIASILYQSFVTKSGQLTFRWYSNLFSPRYEAILGSSPLGSVSNSLLFALISMGISALIGLPIAYLIAKGEFRGRRLFDTMTMAPLAISSITLGFALYEGFSRGMFGNFPRWLAIVIAHSILAYPFFIRAVVPQLENLNTSLIETARSLGAGRLKAFFDIELPLISPGILVGAVFAFAISLGEMSATIMLVKPELKTIPITIYNLIGARKFGQASAMSILLIFLVGLAFIVIERMGEKILRK